MPKPGGAVEVEINPPLHVLGDEPVTVTVRGIEREGYPSFLPYEF